MLFARHLKTALLVSAVTAVAGLSAEPALGDFGDRTLRPGMQGDDVKTMQTLLRRLDYPVPLDGLFGASTEKELRAYERRCGSAEDGRLAPAEAATLRRESRRTRCRRSAEEPPAGRDTPRENPTTEPHRPDAQQTPDVPAEPRPADRPAAPDRDERNDRASEEREAPTPQTVAFGERTLKRGLKGEDVKTLQRLLGDLGHPTGVDGDFGPATEAAVRAYEAGRGLRVNGVVPRGQAKGMRRRAAATPRSGGVPTSGHVFPIGGPHNYGGPSNRFGDDRGTHLHQGQDIFAAAGTGLVSVTAGVVHARQYQASGAGNYIVIRGDDGTDYVYMHMMEPGYVAPGQRVRAGQSIGRVGCTGRCYGAHLHFETWTAHWFAGGRAFDPLPRLKAWDR